MKKDSSVKIILIAHNLRSCHNVGSLLRTAEGLGLDKVYLTGYTPFPALKNDSRLPHISRKINEKISKTSLGAENMIGWEHQENLDTLINKLKGYGFVICALEQADNSILLPEFHTPEKIALIVGREVEGIEKDVLLLCDHIVEIPMFGQKESFNVVQAAAMALYDFKFG